VCAHHHASTQADRWIEKDTTSSAAHAARRKCSAAAGMKQGKLKKVLVETALLHPGCCFHESGERSRS
jgi:hypothetical protein